jgi:hypothetical protein
MKHYSTVSNNEKDNIVDILDYIKTEKRNTKKARKKKSLFDDDRILSLKEEEVNKSKSRAESNFEIKDYYKLYINELEGNIDELLRRNEELESKLSKLEITDKDNFQIKLDALKYKKYKKLSAEFKSELTNNIIEYKNYNKRSCENPVCTTSLISLIELQKEYDKILTENIKLKKQNNDLKLSFK